MALTRYALLDANVIIEAYDRGKWDKLVARASVVVPEVVAKEVEGIRRATWGSRHWLYASGVDVYAASALQLFALVEQFDHPLRESLHPGELEALALLSDERFSQHRFCTADVPAIRALCIMDKSGLAISLEELFKIVGFPQSFTGAKQHFSDTFFRRVWDTAKIEAVQRRELPIRGTKSRKPR